MFTKIAKTAFVLSLLLQFSSGAIIAAHADTFDEHELDQVLQTGSDSSSSGANQTQQAAEQTGSTQAQQTPAQQQTAPPQQTPAQQQTMQLPQTPAPQQTTEPQALPPLRDPIPQEGRYFPSTGSDATTGSSSQPSDSAEPPFAPQLRPLLPMNNGNKHPQHFDFNPSQGFSLQKQSLAPRTNFDSLNSLTNFHVVTPTLVRGAQPAPADYAKLRAAGVRTVVDLRNEDILVKQEAEQARAAGLNFVSIPLDVFNGPSEDAVQKFFSVVDNGQAQPVYVHCLHGQDRTGTMVALYRIERQGWNGDQAYQEMLSCGFRPGFGRLTQTVFAHAARAGRPGTPPDGGDIVLDLKRRFSHQK